MDDQGLHESIEELRSYFHNVYGMEKEWPRQFQVSHKVFAEACKMVFKWHIDNHLYQIVPGVGYILPEVRVGMNGGIMFKNVELIIKKESEPLVEPRTKAGSLD